MKRKFIKNMRKRQKATINILIPPTNATKKKNEDIVKMKNNRLINSGNNYKNFMKKKQKGKERQNKGKST